MSGGLRVVLLCALAAPARALVGGLWTSRVATAARWQDALAELAPQPLVLGADDGAGGGRDTVALLFVSSRLWEDGGAGGRGRGRSSFAEIVRAACDALGTDALVSVVSDGVIGGRREIEGEPALALLTGPLPPGSAVHAIALATGATARAPLLAASARAAASAASTPLHSFLTFVDPFYECAALLRELGELFDGAPVCGGLSAPPGEEPSIALGPRVLPVGSAIVLGFAGAVAMHAVVAQGCRPVGPSFAVTACDESLVVALDGMPALEQLQLVVDGASDDERKLMEHALLCGLGARDDDAAADGRDSLVRIILGVTQQGAILIGVGDGELHVGTRLQFQIRSRASAQQDLDTQLQRYRLERQFSPAAAALARAPCGGVLFSCNGRGQRLFGVSNHDSECIQAALADLGAGAGADGAVPLGGFFANGEIGPVGISLGGGGSRTHMHGFTSVLALLFPTADT
ncbi:hypothetical protein KFE25_011674 [Diacronema lutheri]|uniref:FIST C-domain domain-containing protein n=1 Tax=Diacronema lutheri TaxID=2081491 RepID=A0A8J5X7W9_DIALT|nr:hypothetical protein KFE25_011674 [Diacronema lutheri]